MRTMKLVNHLTEEEIRDKIKKGKLESKKVDDNLECKSG
jgi:hypothetical protein